MIQKINNDCIRGRRLTNAESTYLMCLDLSFVSGEVLEEVLKPFVVNREEGVEADFDIQRNI